MMNQVLVTQFTIPFGLCAAREEPENQLNHLLEIFQLEHIQCNIKEVIYPLQTDLNRHVVPALETSSQFWFAWDEPMSSEHRVHFLVMELGLYRAMHAAARGAGFIWHFAF